MRILLCVVFAMRIIFYFIAGFLIFVTNMLAFFPLPAPCLKVKFEMMATCAIIGLVFVLAMVTSRFKAWQPSAGITLLVAGSLSAFTILANVFMRASPDFVKLFPPQNLEYLFGALTTAATLFIGLQLTKYSQNNDPVVLEPTPDDASTP